MKGDNREYDYSGITDSDRLEYPLIAAKIEAGSSVIDLACGNGSLLQLLTRDRNCSCQGVEISSSGVAAARTKGLTVVKGPIDQGLPQYGDQQFDYAVCNVTLQMVMYPDRLMEEMGRIAKRQIIAFPNFANYRNRLDLLLRGRMPRPCLFGYEWYNTGHLHQLSVRDFEDFCKMRGLRILSRDLVEKPRSCWKRRLAEKFPNLFAVTILFVTETSGH